jgi:GAF domain-containing protein
MAPEERGILDGATRAIVNLLGESGSFVVMGSRPRAILFTHLPSLRHLPVDLGRHPEIAAAATQRRAILVEDAQSDALFDGVRHLLPRTLRAIAAIPILAGERLAGVVVARSTARRQFGDEARAAAVRIASDAAERLAATER